MSDLRFRMRSHCATGVFRCVLCGEVFEENLTALSLTRGADGPSMPDVGDVCLECLAAGPDGITARALRFCKRLAELVTESVALATELRARALAKAVLASQLQSQARATGALALELRAVDWPTVEAWRAFQDAHDAEIDKAASEHEGAL